MLPKDYSALSEEEYYLFLKRFLDYNKEKTENALLKYPRDCVSFVKSPTREKGAKKWSK